MEQISGEIAALEEERPTYVVMQKLAALYIVRDHMALDAQSAVVITGEVIPQLMSDSEFSKAVSGKKSREVMALMDEAMEAMSVLNPRLYASVMDRARSLTTADEA